MNLSDLDKNTVFLDWHDCSYFRVVAHEEVRRKIYNFIAIKKKRVSKELIDLGIEDEYHRFYNPINMSLFRGHLKYIIDFCKRFNVKLEMGEIFKKVMKNIPSYDKSFIEKLDIRKKGKSLNMRDYQQNFVDYSLTYRSCIGIIATGGGKCHGIDTPILMADGSIIPVQEVKVGDQLASPTGGAKNVLSLARGRENLYRITPTKGDSYVVNESHILSLKKTRTKSRIKLPYGKILGLEPEIVNITIKEYLLSSKTAKHCLKGWRSNYDDWINHSDSEMIIPPYILGVWLGDGSQSRSVALTKPEGVVSDAWIKYGSSLNMKFRKSDNNGTKCPTWFLTNGVGQKNQVLDKLRTLNLINNRHIPKTYLTSSKKNRELLLAGIIDTDGSATKSGIDYVTKDENLANDVCFLARSLGLAAYVKPCIKTIKSSGFEGNYFRIYISGDGIHELPIKDVNKVPTIRKQKKDALVHGIKVECVGEGDYYGFELDGDHLYMLGDFTVTHNTLSTYAMIRYLQNENPDAKILMVVPSVTLVKQGYSDFEEYSSHDDWDVSKNCYRIGGKFKDAPKNVCITTWQSLKNRKKQFFEKYQHVFIDEVHGADAKVLKNVIIKCKNAFTKVGMTGSIKGSGKNIDPLSKMTLEGLFGGRVKVFVTARQLMERGYVPWLKIAKVEFKYKTAEVKRFKKLRQENRYSNKDKPIHMAKLAEYRFEKEYVRGQNSRIIEMLNYINRIDGNSIVFFENIEYGEKLKEVYEKYYKKKTYFISGKVEYKAREKILYKEIEESTEPLVLFASYGTLSTGISVDNIDAGFMGESYKARVKILQSIGRLLRGTKALIFDFRDNISGDNMLFKHSKERDELYEDSEYENRLYIRNI